MAYRDARSGEYVTEEFAKANPDVTVYVAEPESKEEGKPYILSYFTYEHLPAHLQMISIPFHQLAHAMYERLGGTEECMVGLRKLLEAKDCMVRAAVL